MLPNAGIVPAATSIAANKKILKAAAGKLFGLNMSASVAGWFLLFDAADKPADGTVTPVKAWPVGANQALELEYDPPLAFVTGITVAFSTTGPYSLTASATAFISGEVI